MNITIIGAGNVAWHLAKAMEQIKVAVNEIYARNPEEAQRLADALYSARAVSSLDFTKSKSEMFFLCVSDDAIASVAEAMVLPDGAAVVHTSGARPLADLRFVTSAYHGKSVPCGVFYPLQTFSRNVPVQFRNVPILVEADDERTLSILTQLARKISGRAVQVTSKDRLIYHVAAVFSCNFTNHLWAVSKEVLVSEGLDFDVLKPLITETFQKMLQAEHPAQVQTGPALRRDVRTQQAHLDFLKEDDDLVKVYRTLSESISDWHQGP